MLSITTIKNSFGSINYFNRRNSHYYYIIAKIKVFVNILNCACTLLTASRKAEGNYTREVVSATPEQLSVIEVYLRAIEGNDKPSHAYQTEGLEKLATITDNPHSVNTLLRKASANSSGVKLRSNIQEEVDRQLDAILNSSSKPLTGREVRDKLQDLGIRLDERSVLNRLDGYTKLGKALAAHSTRGRIYSITPTDTP